MSKTSLAYAYRGNSNGDDPEQETESDQAVRSISPDRTAEALRESEARLRALQNEFAHLARINELGEMAAAEPRSSSRARPRARLPGERRR